MRGRPGVGADKSGFTGMEVAEAPELRRFRTLRGPWYAIFIGFTCIAILLSVNQIFTIQFFVKFVIQSLFHDFCARTFF